MSLINSPPHKDNQHESNRSIYFGPLSSIGSLEAGQQSVKQSAKRPIFFDGIIFRDKKVLQELGIYTLLTHQQIKNGSNKPGQDNSFLSMGIKLALDRSANKLIKVLFTQIGIESQPFEVKFAFVENKFRYCNYDFVKVNFVAQSSHQTIKLLLCNSSFDRLVHILNRKYIRFYIIPQVERQNDALSQLLTLQQLCSLDQKLQISQFQQDKIQYTASCTFNGIQACFAVFTKFKVIILHGKKVLKVIDKGRFGDKQYWIESEEDWISFKSKDHLLVFKEKVEQVVVKAEELKSRLSTIKKNEEQIKRRIEEFQEQINGCNILNQTQLKISNNCGQRRRFCSEPVENKHIIVEVDCLRKKLFDMDQKMVDEEEELKDKIIQQIIQQPIILGCEENQSYQMKDQQIVQQDIVSQMADQSQSRSILHLKQNQSFQNESITLRQQPILHKLNFTTYQSQLIQSQFQNKVFNSQKFELEQVTVRTVFDHNTRQTKQNCKNLMNQPPELSKSYKIEIQQQRVQQQYIYSRKQNLIKLQEYMPSQELADDDNFLHTVPIYSDKKTQKRVQCKCFFSKIHQISENVLVGLTTDKQLRLYKRNLFDNYEKQESIPIIKPYQIFRTNTINKLLFSEQDSINLCLYNFSDHVAEQIKLPYIRNDEIKDAFGINHNEFVIMTNKSVQMIDKRQNGHRRQISFKNNQLFQKLSVRSSIVTIGRGDGKVKLYDLRQLKAKALNSFDLSGISLKKSAVKFSNSFKKIQILQNSNIFCQYNSSSYLINGENNDGKNIFTQNIKHSQRSFIVKHQIHPKIINAIDQYCDSQDENINFTIDRRGESVIALYRNCKFQFNAQEQKLLKWNKINRKSEQSYFYLNFNEFSDKTWMIQGLYIGNKQCFTVSSI